MRTKDITGKYERYFLPLLLVVSIATHFPFVLKGFGELDATRIGVSVIDIIKYGSQGAFINFYFTDVIPLYILYLKLFMKLIHYKYEYLPIIMNYTNAVFGVLSVIPCYILISRLYNSSAAFCSVLALIFAPGFYQSTIAGFPHLISFFFLVSSYYFYLLALERNHKAGYDPWMMLTLLFLTVALLFKLDYILGVGTYFGFLYIKGIRSKREIFSTCLIVIAAGLLTLVIRYLIIGPTGGATSSNAGMSQWARTFLGSSPTSIDYLKRQVPPIIYAAGVVTFALGTIAFIYHLVKKNTDLLVFNISWAALPTIAWIIIHGNNARHNMLSILPFLVIIVMLFYQKARKYLLVLTVALIVGNYFATPPSSSILRPSGDLFGSHAMLEKRMSELHSRAKEIAAMKGDKIVILGYFHNPYVIFEILSSAPSYDAVKIGREDYRIRVGQKEYMVFYFDVMSWKDMKERISNLVTEYNLSDYVFVSATYDLEPLNKLGLKTKTFTPIKASL